MLQSGLSGGLERNVRQFGRVIVHADAALNDLDFDWALRLIIQADRAVKACALVAVFVDVSQEVRAGDRCLWAQLEHNFAEAGLDLNAGHAKRLASILCSR
jgi:hypothetical protein